MGWTKGFPGAQPVSMTRGNMGFLRDKPYKVRCAAHIGSYWDFNGNPIEISTFVPYWKSLVLGAVCVQVSWKADGTRYMMLLDGEDEVYFIDRDNCVYKVRYLGTWTAINI